MNKRTVECRICGNQVAKGDGRTAWALCEPVFARKTGYLCQDCGGLIDTWWSLRGKVKQVERRLTVWCERNQVPLDTVLAPAIERAGLGVAAALLVIWSAIRRADGLDLAGVEALVSARLDEMERSAIIPWRRRDEQTDNRE